jgi:hypothetical protein
LRAVPSFGAVANPLGFFKPAVLGSIQRLISLCPSAKEKLGKSKGLAASSGSGTSTWVGRYRFSAAMLSTSLTDPLPAVEP